MEAAIDSSKPQTDSLDDQHMNMISALNDLQKT